MHEDIGMPAGRPALTPASLERFDPFAIWWGRLSDQQRMRIGVAGLLYGLAMGMDDPGWAAVGLESEQLLQQLATEALGVQLSRLSLPTLDAFDIRACAVCGCTDSCGCPEGCSWSTARLCSVCYPAALAAAAAAPSDLLDFAQPGKGIVPDDDPTLQRCVDAGLAWIYAGAGAKSAWAATPWAKLLLEAKAGEMHQEVHHV